MSEYCVNQDDGHAFCKDVYVLCFAQITESGDYIIPNEPPGQPEEYTKVFSLLADLVQERNHLTEVLQLN